MLTAALNEPGTALPDRPTTTLSGGRLSGTKIGVPYAEHADWLVVTTDGGVVVVSPKAAGVTLTKTPTSNHSDEYVVDVRRCHRAGLGRARPARTRASRQPAGAGDHRGVRRRARRGRAAPDGRLRGHPRAVRQAAVDVPDRRRATRRGLHRLAHDLVGRDVRRLAAVGGTRRRRGPRRARLLADVAGAAGDADLPPPARRHGHGHHLPDGPLLLDDQGPDPAAGRSVASLDLVGAQCSSN